MARTHLANGRVIDPANRRDAVGDLWLEDGRIVAAPGDGRPAAETHDLAGLVVMAGAIDIHSHIAGGQVNTARLLLPEFGKAHRARPAGTPLTRLGWTTEETGRLYAAMGFTLVVEPAMAPSSALHSHLELADIPIIDKATLVVLGNDDVLLGMLRAREDEAAVDDYVAWAISATKALGVKVINAGGSAAFKQNVRSFSFDDVVPDYGMTSRAIVKALQASVTRLGIPHPLHVHCNNLGQAGSADTAAETIRAAEGVPLHLAHLQFYGYGREGRRGFSSEAARLAALVNGAPEITVDIGQLMFGPAVTISSDEPLQFNSRAIASPRKSVITDGDANGGGVVPMNFRATSYHNALQWCIGLELFLLIEDPARVFFTTDHPNGAPFTAYPDIFALLMSRDVRARWLEGLPKEAVAMSGLPAIRREYTLEEIAVMTRSAPARLLGVGASRGHLGPGAVADVAVYRPSDDKAAMFGRAAFVFKDGDLVVRDGEVVRRRRGRTLTLAPAPDPAMVRRLERFYDEKYGLPLRWFTVRAEALGAGDPFEAVPCRT